MVGTDGFMSNLDGRLLPAQQQDDCRTTIVVAHCAGGRSRIARILSKAAVAAVAMDCHVLVQSL
jgi:hypothetical protein